MPSIELTDDLIQLIAIASVELTAKNDTATETWGIGHSDSWAADLEKGTLTFSFPDRVISGPVHFLGSFSAQSYSWQWGWANGAVPESVTESSRLARSYGQEHGVPALTTPRLALSKEWLADDLAAVAVEVAGLAGMYRGPTANGVYVYLGFSDFHVQPAPAR